MISSFDTLPVEVAFTALIASAVKSLYGVLNFLFTYSAKFLALKTAFVLKKYAEENNKEIYTTAKEADANYYAISKLNIPQYNGNNQNAIETSPYYENGTFFDKYGNKRMQNAIFNGISLADYVNSKLNTPYSDLTTEAEKAVNATSTGKVTNEEIINASKLFIKK